MRYLETTDASASLAEHARQLKNEPVVVTEDGRPIAALISIRGVDRESLSLSTNPDFVELIRKAKQEIVEGKTSSLEEVRREFA